MGPSTPPLRLLWLTKGLGRGGAERLIVDAATLVDRDRFCVEVAYLLPWKNALVGELEAAGVPVRCLGQESSYDMSWVPRLHRLVRSQRYDLVHTHAPVPAVAARLFLGRSGPRLVHTEHNVWQRYRWPTYWANALTYGRNDRVVAVSQAVAASVHSRRAPRHDPESLEVVLHGLHPTRATPADEGRRQVARDKLELPADVPVVGTVGNLTAKNDHSTLLRAFRRVLTEQPDARLVVIGTGVLEDQLHQEAVELGLADRTVFTGSRPDVDSLLPALDVFVMTSRFEGLPIALLEALAASLPAVATPVGGITEVLTDGQEGFLVPVGDAAAVAGRVLALLQDVDLRAEMGAAAHRRSLDFDMATAVRRLEAIYDEVLAR